MANGSLKLRACCLVPTGRHSLRGESALSVPQAAGAAPLQTRPSVTSQHRARASLSSYHRRACWPQGGLNKVGVARGEPSPGRATLRGPAPRDSASALRPGRLAPSAGVGAAAHPEPAPAACPWLLRTGQGPAGRRARPGASLGPPPGLANPELPARPRCALAERSPWVFLRALPLPS